MTSNDKENVFSNESIGRGVDGATGMTDKQDSPALQDTRAHGGGIAAIHDISSENEKSQSEVGGTTPPSDENKTHIEKTSSEDCDQPGAQGNKFTDDRSNVEGSEATHPTNDNGMANSDDSAVPDHKPSDDAAIEHPLKHIKFQAPTRFDGPSDLAAPDVKPEDQRWYAGMDNYDLSYGVSAVFSRFRPEIESKDHSLIQLGAWHIDSSHPRQSVEAGWRRYGHAEPVVFIYFTTTNYKAHGAGSGGYVEDFDRDDGDFRWLPFAVKPRAQYFTGLPVSHIDGDQLTVGLRWKLLKGVSGMVDGWYLAVDDIFYGYYPSSLFTVTPPATLLNPSTGAPYGPLDPSKTLAHEANHVSIYGEIYDDGYNRALFNPGVPTTTDMGSGKFPIEGWGKAAFINKIMRRSDMGETWEDASLSTWSLKAGDFIDTTKYDLFFSPNMGSSFGAFVYVGGAGNAQASGNWTEWDVISPNNLTLDVPPNVHVTAVTRVHGRIDLFAVSPDGVVRSCHCSEDDWSGINKVDDWDVINWGQDHPVFGWGTEIVALSRDEWSLDIFGVGDDGHIWTARWSLLDDWSGWWNISKTMNFPKNAPLAGCVRSDSHMDLFVNNNGSIVTATWDNNVRTWSGAENDWLAIDSDQPDIMNNAPVLALARDEDTMDVFVVANNTVVYDVSYVTDPDGEEASWGSFEPIGTMHGDGGAVLDGFNAGARLAGVARGSDKIDLFCVGTDGDLHSSLWTVDDGWSSVGGDDGDYWSRLGSSPSGVTFGADSYITALVRPSTSNIDLFVGGGDGLIYRTAWDEVKQSWMSDPVIGDLAWDLGVGGAIRGDPGFHNRLGFSFSVASAQVFALMVIGVQQNARIYATIYEGP